MDATNDMKSHLKDFARFLVRHRIHFISWFFFILYEIALTGILRGYFASAGNYIVFYVLNISLFYFHAHVVLTTVHKKANHNIWILVALIAFEIIIYVPFTIIVVGFLHRYAGLSVFSEVSINKESVGNGLWRTIYFMLFSSGYYYLTNYLKERKITQQAEKERLMMLIENQLIQAELIKSQHAHLKAQINPHFLFNTLSFIYANTRKVVPEAADAILALSEMMRYALQDDSERTFTPLVQELEQVKNLIKLHQIKSEHKLHILFRSDDNLDEIQIIPFVLITLVENMLKHGDLLQPEYPAIISIFSDGNDLVIETENLINRRPTGTSHHIGLSNAKKRLSMVYDDKASLEISTGKDNYFNVLLRIKLNQYY